jgi:DNA-binding response OmpR family regulator
VLVVEDEFMIANALQMLFEKQGARVVGPVARVSAALELIVSGQHIDCALLDVRLRGEQVFPVADALRARGVRVAFLSGYDRSALPAAYRDATYFDKLDDPMALVRWVLLSSQGPQA